jgi:3-hydroxybutyryl-CoA dehydrogenase
MPYELPDDVDERPVTVVGAGTLGRRIAAAFAAGGTDVRILDVSEDQSRAAAAFVAEEVDAFQEVLGVASARVATVHVAGDLGEAVSGAWMVVEAISEDVDVKTRFFGELDRLAERDAILATNSSSIASSRIVSGVEHPERVLNTHFYRPPENNAVELMSCGATDDGVIDALAERLPRYGLIPFRVRRESDGFILNRVWAAIKRECLMVVEEGVATPEDVDRMWEIFTRPGIPPFRLMDRVGLDVVLAIEEHYASVRPELPDAPRRLLQRYVDDGRLGEKSGSGFYEVSANE